MADTTTTNYGWIKPEVGASSDSWGAKLNAGLDGIDAALKAVSNTTAEALARGVGMVSTWPGSVASIPTGYLLANGNAVSRTTYAALFAVYGTQFGAGDGSTTFNLPNYIDRFIVGAGSTYTPASTGGSTTQIITVAGHALTISEMPQHNHGVNESPHTHTVNDGQHRHDLVIQNNLIGNSPGSGAPGFGSGEQTLPSTSNISINANSTGISIQNNGSGAAHTHTASGTTNLPPYIAGCPVVRY